MKYDPRHDDHIEPLAAMRYASGKTPHDVGEQDIVAVLMAHHTLSAHRSPDLPPLPGWEDLTYPALARRILGTLMGAGWRPPSEAVQQAAAERSRAASARFDAWWNALHPEDQAIAMAHYSETGEWPASIQPPSEGPSSAVAR